MVTQCDPGGLDKAAATDKALSGRTPVEHALFECSPGVQEVFDRWPSMSYQHCQDAAGPNRAELPTTFPVNEGIKRDKETTAAPPSKEHDCKGETERPESAGDLIPPTQEAPTVTPRIKVTASLVQSPRTASPLNQSTPSVSRRSQRAASTGGRRPQKGNCDMIGANREPDPAPCHGRNVKSSPRAEQNPKGLAAPPGDEESSMIEAGFSLQLSQDASLSSSDSGIFSIIDVASDRRLFETFVQEWRTKERYSLALACQRMEKGPSAATGNSQRLTVITRQFRVEYLDFF